MWKVCLLWFRCVFFSPFLFMLGFMSGRNVVSYLTVSPSNTSLAMIKKFALYRYFSCKMFAFTPASLRYFLAASIFKVKSALWMGGEWRFNKIHYEPNERSAVERFPFHPASMLLHSIWRSCTLGMRENFKTIQLEGCFCQHSIKSNAFVVTVRNYSFIHIFNLYLNLCSTSSAL